jgi:hypothetical protein
MYIFSNGVRASSSYMSTGASGGASGKFSAGTTVSAERAERPLKLFVLALGLELDEKTGEGSDETPAEAVGVDRSNGSPESEGEGGATRSDKNGGSPAGLVDVVLEAGIDTDG